MTAAMDKSNSQEDLLKTWEELSKDDMVRGETPTNIAEKSLKLCQKYVGGVWLQAQTIKDIEVTRIKGGLTNQLYKVALGAHIAKQHEESVNEPHAVALKLYQPKHAVFADNLIHDAFERLPDAIVLSMVSQSGISPKVYGIFPDGFVQRFYEVEFIGRLLNNMLFNKFVSHF